MRRTLLTALIAAAAVSRGAAIVVYYNVFIQDAMTAAGIVREKLTVWNPRPHRCLVFTS